MNRNSQKTPTLTAAIQAATDAVMADEQEFTTAWIIEVAVTAAVPVLRRQMAEQIEAMLIEEPPQWDCTPAIEETLRVCAALVRGDNAGGGS
jgi:hypothetical protein